MKRRATGLLVVMAAVFLAVLVLADDHGWPAYLRAAAEGSLVGGLADWFAVTALFRHPLGLPIPHTAVIRERKDQFGETLGAFVQENFLSAEVVGDRVRAAAVPQRLAAWLAEDVNAEMVARHAGDLLVGLADVVRDDDVHRVLDEELDRAVRALPLAALTGRAVRMMTAQQRHQELFDAVARGIGRVVHDNRDALRERFGQEAPWWLPDAVEDRIFERVVDRVGNLLASIATDPDHEARVHFNTWVEDLSDRLETSPELHERVEHLKHELLSNPEVRAWSASIWADVKSSMREQAADPDSALRRRLAGGVMALGRRLQDDPVLLAKTEDVVESAIRYVGENFHDEIAELVSGTIAHWDPAETSDKLELLLGRDLQFIRINGTVVGGIAGLAIHALSRLAG